MWKGNWNITTLLFYLKRLEILHWERRRQLNISIAFCSTSPDLLTQHTYQPIKPQLPLSSKTVIQSKSVLKCSQGHMVMDWISILRTYVTYVSEEVCNTNTIVLASASVKIQNWNSIQMSIKMFTKIHDDGLNMSLRIYSIYNMHACRRLKCRWVCSSPPSPLSYKTVIQCKSIWKY